MITKIEVHENNHSSRADGGTAVANLKNSFDQEKNFFPYYGVGGYYDTGYFHGNHVLGRLG